MSSSPPPPLQGVARRGKAKAKVSICSLAPSSAMRRGLTSPGPEEELSCSTTGRGGGEGVAGGLTGRRSAARTEPWPCAELVGGGRRSSVLMGSARGGEWV